MADNEFYIQVYNALLYLRRELKREGKLLPKPLEEALNYLGRGRYWSEEDPPPSDDSP